MALEKSKIPVLVIFAPTATGKTEIVGRLFSDNAPCFFAGKGEVVSADSVQVYKKLDIGTAKPDKAFLSHLPHHLIDICALNEQFGVGDFLPLADKKCAEIFSRSHLPIICGGTSFFIKNFIFGLPVTPEKNENVRAVIQNRLKTEGNEALYAELQSVDAESAAKININDEYRICRALEVFYDTGKPLSTFKLPKNPREQYDFLTLYIFRPKDEIFSRINERVLKMFERGLVDEVKGLIQDGVTSDYVAMSAIGYREFFTSGENPREMFHLLDENKNFCSDARYLVWLAEIKRQIQRDSRLYAKKQIRFFDSILHLQGNPANVHIVNAENISEMEQIIKAHYDDSTWQRRHHEPRKWRGNP